MQKTYLLFVILFLSSSSIYAKKVFGDLDFTQGEWALIGVPLHNYQSMPIQKELGTFISKDVSFMQRVQQRWDLVRTFEDKCDYHYALKFYKDGKLIETVKLNLHCGYLTHNNFSYTFDPTEFDLFKKHSNSIGWSRISFADLDLLKTAIQKLDATQDIYWYQDVEQYLYSGYFMVSVNGLPWSTNMDSLNATLQTQISQQTGGQPFYLKKYYHVFRSDYLYVRYIVNCDASLPKQVQLNQTLSWRSHLAGTDSVRIVAIGVDEKKYWEIMENKR